MIIKRLSLIGLLFLIGNLLFGAWLDDYLELADSVRSDPVSWKSELLDAINEDSPLPVQRRVSYLLLSSNVAGIDSKAVTRYIRKALELSRRHDMHSAEAFAEWELARLENKAGDQEEAQKLYRNAIKHAKLTLPSHFIAVLHLEIATFFEQQNLMRAASREAMEAVLEINALSDRTLMIRAYRQLGQYFDRQGMIINSLEYYDKAYILSQELDDPLLSAELAINVGNAHQRKGEFDLALAAYFEAIDSFSKANRKDMLAVVYDRVATIYRKLGEIPKAIEYMTNAQILNISLQNWANVGDNYMNLGLLYNDLKQDNTALTYFKKALSTYTKVENFEGMALSNSKIGLSLAESGEFQDAIRYSQKSIEIAKDKGLTRLLTALLIDLSDVQAMAGNSTEAISALSEASVVLREGGGNKEYQLQIEKSIAELKEKQGNIHSAITHYRQAMNLQDKLYDDLSHQKLAEMEILFESFQKEKEIEKLENNLAAQRLQAEHDKFYYETQLELENLKSRNQRVVMISMALLVIGAIVFLWYIIARLRRERSLHMKISEQHEALTDAYGQLEKAQQELIEFERLKSMSAMAVTMNHEINQPLMIIQGNLDMLRINIEKRDADDDQLRFVFRIQTSLERIMGIMEHIEKLDRVQYGDYTEGTSMVKLGCANADPFEEEDESV